MKLRYRTYKELGYFVDTNILDFFTDSFIKYFNENINKVILYIASIDIGEFSRYEHLGLLLLNYFSNNEFINPVEVIESSAGGLLIRITWKDVENLVL